MTGDVADIQARLRSLLPPWFQSAPAPVLDSLLKGSATAFAWVYSLSAFVQAQTRLLTMSGSFLDLFAFDFFGWAFMRRNGEGDAPFLVRIQKELFRERATRKGLSVAITDLVGVAPTMFEPWNPGDCGGYDTPTSCGYDTAGFLGAYDLPFQIFMRVTPPHGQGIPNIIGWGDPAGGYDVGGQFEYVDPAQAVGAVTIPDVYRTINQTRAAGIIVWTQIAVPPSGQVGAALILNQPYNSGWLLLTLLI